ncbi:MAG: molybdopterin oxidoreductase family protein [Micromonosporaceae bacterium]
MPELRYGACNLCEAICGLEFTVSDGAVTSIRGDEHDPLSRGHICPKAYALTDVYADPDRLRRPLRRVGDDWQEIGWEEAYRLVGDRLAKIRAEHGADAVGVYIGNPSVHNYGTLTHGLTLLRELGTKNRFSATSVDQLPHQLVSWQLYGHQLLLPVPDIDRTSYFLVFGANPMASNGSLMTVPDVKRRLDALQQRGKLVVFDPRRTETAARADEHHFVRPGTDAALLFALLQVIFDEGLDTPVRYADGLDQVREAVAGFNPERAAEVTGVDAETIRRIAREFSGADAAVAYGRMGVSTQRFGVLCQWAIQLLNIVTGNLDRAGGALVTNPAVDLVGSGLAGRGHLGKWRSRVRGLPEFGGELPVATLAEEVATPGEGQIKALITVAGNPVLSTPNGGQLDAALPGLDFMVAVDIYLNETTRHADVILPPTSALEHDNYDIAFHALAVRNTARYTPAILPAPATARHDWQIIGSLVRAYRRALRRHGVKPRGRWLTRVGRGLALRLRPDQLIGLALRRGPYRLSMGRLRREPHGVDLGPLRPSFPGTLRTLDKRIDAAPALLREGLAAAREELLAAPAEGQLRLIGRRHLRSNNSWLHNSERLVKGRPRHQLLVHPSDLDARGLSDGQRVRVRSRAGEVEIEAKASTDMMPGVVSLPHGWGHGRAGTRQRVAARTPGVSANDLTDETYLDTVSGNAALNGVPVTIEAAPVVTEEPVVAREPVAAEADGTA